MKDNYKIVISIVFSLIILVVGGTYAWYIWRVGEDEETKIATEVGVVTVIYDLGASLTGQKIQPVSDKSLGLTKAITIKTSEEATNKITFNLYLDINTLDEGLKEESFKYALYKSSTLVKEGNFTEEYLNSNLVTCEKNNTSHIVLLEDETVKTTLSTYNLYIWIDGANYTNPNTMQNQSFSFALHATGENAIIEEAKYPDITAIKEGTLAYKIANDYTVSEKTMVTNNGVVYYYDTVDSLMSDIGGNVRYYGASPKNYIYFNCDDYSNQSSDTCELWRIIGVFDNKVKIIRNTSLGSFSWDYDYNDGNGKTTSNNDWSTSSLQTLLNNQYYNSIDTTYYNNSTTGTTVNFNTDNTGLKNDATRNMIADVTWNLGGLGIPSVYLYSNDVYKYERGTTVYSGRPLSWNGKIALMYPSDYGYATDFSKCTSSLNSYKSSTCYGKDWLHISSTIQFFLTHYTGVYYGVKGVGYDGSISHNGYYTTYYAGGVRPVLFLNSELAIESGIGSSSDPYKLDIQ